MAKSSSQGDKNKKIILIALFVVMVGVAAYRFFLEPSPPKRKAESSNSNTARSTSPAPSAPAQTSRSNRSLKDDEAALQQELAKIEPLDFKIVNASIGNSNPGARGNIFGYYIRIEPPPPPQPPPPITLQFIQPQNAVAGTPRPFTLTVVGQAVPADAQIYLDGRQRATRRVNDTTLATDIQPAEYASQGTRTVQIKSPTDPKLISNTVSFIVQPSPEPPFKYVGYLKLGNWGLFEMNSTRDISRLTVGATVQGWRIDSINEKEVEITNLQYEIKRRVLMQDKR
ncbi:MAG TPA: hypothetical protein VID27_03330 [Blastocatellia bacterium]|jgi:hypothetical protein